MTFSINLTDEEKQIVDDLASGKLSFRKADSVSENPERAALLRRLALEKMKNTDLSDLSYFSFDCSQVSKKNIENLVGAVQVPLGIAGPLSISGEFAKGEYHIPLATTEGALVASVNRGCSAITKSGGTTVRIFKNMMTRAPLFKLKSVGEAHRFYNWLTLPETFEKIKTVAENTTRFGKLHSAEPFISGTSVHLRLGFDTKDAMGMNMITIATEAVTQMIEKETGISCLTLSGNMCTDKKPTALNAALGRGKTVVAETLIPKEIIEQTFKCTADSMFQVNYEKNLLGTIRAGGLGFNAHAANIVAALFIACGQDPAHVVEGSLTITQMDLTEDGGLLCTVTMPAVEVGTIGGGTSISSQKACLSILGVSGSSEIPGENSSKLSEIVAASVLAGEISLIGAQAAGHLARAHATLGR
ncbi:MAG: hydroxymethylglutaryl-CoA reductase (NADPH) [Methanosarcinaceae archaeon]|nr:hydroxymethylglutaryl-CoA reductase (NADPH) [Methanosarcinaceae archaeon]